MEIATSDHGFAVFPIEPKMLCKHCNAKYQSFLLWILIKTNKVCVYHAAPWWQLFPLNQILMNTSGMAIYISFSHILQSINANK